MGGRMGELGEAAVPAKMRVGALGVRFMANASLSLPAYAGSTMRGAFGHSLREVGCCRAGESRCPPCRENALAQEEGRVSRCAFGVLFETPVPSPPPERDPSQREHTGSVPHPYVLRPPAGGHYPAGAEIDVILHLIGPGLMQAQAVLHAMRLAGQRGFGDGHVTATVRAMWEQDPVGTRRRPVTEDEDPHAPCLTLDWDGACALARHLDPTALLLHFLTPTHLVRARAPVPRPDFGEVMRGLFRRLALFDGASPSSKHSGQLAALLHYADRVRLVEWKGNRMNWVRYSSRQDRYLGLDGFVGTARYEGDLQPLLAYVVLGQALHIGKGCTVGQGHYVIAP